MEVFKMIWDDLAQYQKDELMSKVNGLAKELYSKNKEEKDINFGWYLNLAFDKEKPQKYIYMEGLVFINPTSITDMNGNNVPVIIAPNFIHVSEDVNDFLDRISESKNNDSILIKLGTINN